MFASVFATIASFEVILFCEDDIAFRSFIEIFRL
jgi:hypothetical protein